MAHARTYSVRESYESARKSSVFSSAAWGPPNVFRNHSSDGNPHDLVLSSANLPAIVQHLLCQLASEYSALQKENYTLQDQVKQLQESLGIAGQTVSASSSEKQPMPELVSEDDRQTILPHFPLPAPRSSDTSNISMNNLNPSSSFNTQMNSIRTFGVTQKLSMNSNVVSCSSVNSVSPSCSFTSSQSQSQTNSYGQNSNCSSRRHLEVSQLLPSIPSGVSSPVSDSSTIDMSDMDHVLSEKNKIRKPSLSNPSGGRLTKLKGKLGYRRSMTAPCNLDRVNEEAGIRKTSRSTSTEEFQSPCDADNQHDPALSLPPSSMLTRMAKNLPAFLRSGTGTASLSVGTKTSAKSALSVLSAVPTNTDQTGESAKKKVTLTLKSPRLPTYFCPSEPHMEMGSNRQQIASLAPSKQAGVLLPYGQTRFWWDIAVCICFFLDFWVTLFTLTFTGNFDCPSALVAVDYFLVFFFFVDIVVNFRTGRIDDGTLVMDASVISKRYLYSWFGLDLVATIPWNVFMPEVMCLTSLLRVVKVANLKSLQYFLILHGPGRRRIGFLMHSIALVFSSLIPLAHIHACLFEVACRRDGLADKHANFDEAFNQYYDDFWWAFTAFAVGSRTAQKPWIRALEICIAAERLIYFMLAAFWGTFHLMVLFKDLVRMATATTDVLAYARQHRVCALTQLQVSCAMHQVAHGKGTRESFYELLGLLPPELRQKIDGEMWNECVMSLELFARISTWDLRFVPRLLPMIGEDVVPAQSVLCWEGESQHKAWKILSGRLTMESTEFRMPDYLEGMWIGENALVNPFLHSIGTMSTKQFTVLMSVPVNEFHKLLDTLGLSSQFKEDCVNHVWRGFCGRCGRFGDHFVQDCPTIAHAKSSRFMTQSERKSHAQMSGSQSDKLSPATPTGVHRDLEEFLYCSELEHLNPVFFNLNILDLDQLEAAIQRGDHKLEYELSPSEHDCVNLQVINDFRKNLAAEVRQKIELMVPKKCLMFLSHYKVEAGTEAALMRAELQALIDRDSNRFGRHFEVPVFLDSENLNDLNALQQHVINSHNLILLLTKGVLLRPWVLVEIATAARNGIPILPLKIEKPEIDFQFPDDEFYAKLRAGDFLDKDAMRVLTECNIDLPSLEKTFRSVFKRIALHYSPHRAASIRQAELESLLRELTLTRRKS